MHRSGTVPRALSLALCALGLAAAAGGGCARSTTAAARPAAATAAPRPAVPANARVIELAELRSARWGTAYDAVRWLRPQYLHDRAPSFDSPGGHAPAVYIDNLYAGGVDALELIPGTAVARIVFLSPSEASFRFGTSRDNRGGAIVVQTVRRL